MEDESKCMLVSIQGQENALVLASQVKNKLTLVNFQIWSNPLLRAYADGAYDTTKCRKLLFEGGIEDIIPPKIFATQTLTSSSYPKLALII